MQNDNSNTDPYKYIDLKNGAPLPFEDGSMFLLGQNFRPTISADRDNTDVPEASWISEGENFVIFLTQDDDGQWLVFEQHFVAELDAHVWRIWPLPKIWGTP